MNADVSSTLLYFPPPASAFNRGFISSSNIRTGEKLASHCRHLIYISYFYLLSVGNSAVNCSWVQICREQAFMSLLTCADVLYFDDL